MEARTPSGAPRSRALTALKTAWPHAFSLLLLLVVFVIARSVTADLDWPCEEDFWRDMGFARTILDGRYGEDPFYLGERVWYPPLVHTLMALIAKVSGAALNVVSVRSGAYLDLLAPIAFYLLALRWGGPSVALFSGIAFLLLGPHDLSSSDGNATYSPWMWPDNFAQGLGYLALLAALFWREETTLRRALVTGSALGVSALAHSAPAFMAAGIITLLTVGDLVIDLRAGENARAKQRLGQLVLIALVSIVVTLPFSLHLIQGYAGTVRNWEGVGWQHEHHTFAGLPLLIRDQVSVRGALAVLGLSFGLSRYALALPRRLPFVWVALAVFGIAWGYLHDWALAKGSTLPILFSSWHFALSLQAAQSLLAGAGLFAFLSWATKTQPARLPLAIAGLALVLTATGLTRYRQRADLEQNRVNAQWRAQREHPSLSQWILENTEPKDVFLASPRQTMFTVAPTGRKVLLMPADFANPYVDPAPRQALLHQLLEAPANDFRRLALENGIRFVILEPGGVLDEVGPLKAVLEHPSWLRQRHSAIRQGPDQPNLRFDETGVSDCPWALTTCEPQGGRVRIFEILQDTPDDAK